MGVTADSERAWEKALADTTAGNSRVFVTRHRI
jgi:hypothetical protein